MNMDFFALQGGNSASLSKAMYMTNSACAVAASGVEIYSVAPNTFDQLIIKISATADITADETLIYVIGRKQD